MGAIIVKVGAETKKIAIDLPPNYNTHRFNDAGTVRGCRLVRPGMFNATPVHTMVDGRVMALAGNVVVPDIDTTAMTNQPDTPFYNWSYLVVSARLSDNIARIYIKCPIAKILHLYCIVGNDNLPSVYEVDPSLYTTKTLTWNNQPLLGAIIGTAPLPPAFSTGWVLINTGTTGAICIKYLDETLYRGTGTFWSSNYTIDPTLRPYFT